MKQECAYTVTQFEFFEEMDDFSTKIEFGQTITWDGRKMLVKCPNKPNAVGYLEILRYDEEKMLFLGIILQQDNALVHKSKIIGKFIQENEWKVLEWPA